ncbi:MAG: pyridoxal phosphate-dependent aminotransferase [Paludibacteraceae bacterium]|jgi:aspartate/methionine/tyrosine aminotransferase|nr:pyridoxal phosphate-dependent aminotransferase [Paludibacteraceae bacterium]MBQ6766380.1 pyridoxal phosphate-dependent aminotransferase [Paludibacteraceae bacterium]
MNKAVDEMTSFLVMDVLEKAGEMSRKGIDIVHLEVGEPDFDVPECVRGAVDEAYNTHVTHYTHSLGDPELRAEIASLYNREYGVNVSPDRILVTSGTSPALLLVTILLCSPGSEVILSNPGYACYKNFVLAAHAKPVFVDLDPAKGFEYNIDDIKSKINSNTAAIFINSPMNPTGAILSEKFMRELATLGVTVVSDEIYHGLVYEGKAHSMLEYADDAIVLNGFSKRFAMTGLRLGYLIAPQKYMEALQKMGQNFLICASSTAQKAGISTLRDKSDYEHKMLSTYNERRLYMIERLRSLGFVIPKDPQGAFYVFADASRFTSDSLKFAFDVLENAHVGITPGVDFGTGICTHYVRFSYANSLERIKEGLDRLERYLVR